MKNILLSREPKAWLCTALFFAAGNWSSLSVLTPTTQPKACSTTENWNPQEKEHYKLNTQNYPKIV